MRSMSHVRLIYTNSSASTHNAPIQKKLLFSALLPSFVYDVITLKDIETCLPY